MRTEHLPLEGQAPLKSRAQASPADNAPKENVESHPNPQTTEFLPVHLSGDWWRFVFLGPSATNTKAATRRGIKEVLPLLAPVSAMTVGLLLQDSGASIRLTPQIHILKLRLLLMIGPLLLVAIVPFFVRASYLAIRRHDAEEAKRGQNLESTSASQPPTGDSSPHP